MNHAVLRALAKQEAWHVLNARDAVVGRLATQAAMLLQGKGRVDYAPHKLGDVVVILNSKHVVLTGKKWQDGEFIHHTGWVGGLKRRNFARVHDQDPTFVMRRAISRMLPKNRLRKARLRRLFIFPEEEHPFEEEIRKWGVGKGV